MPWRRATKPRPCRACSRCCRGGTPAYPRRWPRWRRPDLVPRIAELAGTIDDEIVANALGEYVGNRSDVPEKLRIDVLRTIGRLSGAVATTALAEYLASVPAKEDRACKDARPKSCWSPEGGGATP